MAKKGGFPGMGMNMNMAKQVQKMQKQMEEMQRQLEEMEMEGTAGGGVVKCRVNGKNELVALTIAPEAVDPDDVEMLQDLVIAAVNEAFKNAENKKNMEMGKLTGGMNLPGLF